MDAKPTVEFFREDFVEALVPKKWSDEKIERFVGERLKLDNKIAKVRWENYTNKDNENYKHVFLNIKPKNVFTATAIVITDNTGNTLVLDNKTMSNINTIVNTALNEFDTPIRAIKQSKYEKHLLINEMLKLIDKDKTNS